MLRRGERDEAGGKSRHPPASGVLPWDLEEALWQWGRWLALAQPRWPMFPGHSVQLLSLTGPHVSLSQPAPSLLQEWLDGGCRVLLPCRKAG